MASLRIKWALFSCPCRGVRGRGLKKKTQLRLPRVLGISMCLRGGRFKTQLRVLRKWLYQVGFLIWFLGCIGFDLFRAIMVKMWTFSLLCIFFPKAQLRLPRILAHWMCFEESRWLIRRSLYQVRFEFLIWISRFVGFGLFPALIGKGVNLFYSVNGKNLNFFCFIGLVLLPLSFAIAHGGVCNFCWGRFILWIGGMTVIIMAIPNFKLLR